MHKFLSPGSLPTRSMGTTWTCVLGWKVVMGISMCSPSMHEPVGICTPDGVRRQVEVREVEALMALSAQNWQRLSMGDGTKGPRLYDWVCVPILHRWGEDDEKHWLLIRR